MITCLTCSDCGIRFEYKDKIYRIRNKGEYQYYHITCGNIENFIETGGVIIVAQAQYFHKLLQLTEKLMKPKKPVIKRTWTPQEKQFIIDNQHIRVKELSKIMNILPNLISNMKANLGIRKGYTKGD